MHQRVRHVVIISGPGGVGKGTIVRALMARDAQVGALTLARSATTRAPRPDEEDGVHYDFVSPEAFDAMVADGGFLEWATFGANRYGTPAYVIDQADTPILILEIDCQGFEQVRAMPDRLDGAKLHAIFIAPPSWETLEARLKGRDGQDNPHVATRLAIGREEMAMADDFDYVVVNDDLDAAIEEVEGILHHLDQASGQANGEAGR